MALVLHDRVQEITTTTGTGPVTLTGAVTGYQDFSVIGNGNTTFYCIAGQGTSEWEVGLGTYTSSGTTLSRDTVLASSNSGSAVNFSSGSKSVFVTYPSEKSVNLDASGNVSALGTITSGVWNGTTIPVAYGGTGVTTDSGPNSVVLRDANGNISGFNNVEVGLTKTTSAGGTTTLTASSTQVQILTGSSNQTFKLPDATTLDPGTFYTFANASSGLLTVVDDASTVLTTIGQGGAAQVLCTDNSTNAGTWGVRTFASSNTTWSNAVLDYNGSIANATWIGDTIGTAYGGTGLTGFGSANYALYSSNATALTAGTLPIAAGGTGQTTASAAFNALSPITTTGDLIVGNGSNSATRLPIGASNQVLTSNGTTATWETLSGGTDIVTTDFTATAGQTTFTVSYVIGLVEVFRNGVKLAQADFTANNGTTVVLATAANSGDIVEVVSYQPINVYANITTDTFSGDGTDTTFTMSVTPYDAASLLVVISGVVQAPDTYSVSGTTLTFSAAPPSGTDNISVRYLGVASTGAVTTFSGGTTGLTPSSATGGAVTLGGTLAIANGGTGANSANAAFNALAPSQTGNSGKYLTTDGANASWDQINISTADITGTLPVANGGTGAATLTGYVYGNGTSAMTASTTIPNSATTATSANTASAIVARDASGNFTAGTITANLTGTASSATNATNATTVTGATQNSITSIPNLATVGTVTSGTWSGSFGAVSGANLTTLNASNLASGTVATARLASGTASSSTYLRGDQTWASIPTTSPGGSNTQVQYNSSGSFAGSSNLTFDGTNLTCGGNITANSDERLKENWRNVQTQFVEKLANIKCGVFDRKDIEATQVGVSAQSLQTLLEEAVQMDSNGILSVAYGPAALVAAIELAKEVVLLKAELAELRSK